MSRRFLTRARWISSTTQSIAPRAPSVRAPSSPTRKEGSRPACSRVFGWRLHRPRTLCSCPTLPSGSSRCASLCWWLTLNYLWDETIHELRKPVVRYDLEYFFDLAVTNPEKRKKLSTEEDLTR